MKEYFGKSAKNYGQPQDKYFTLFPALEKALPKAKKGQSLVDLGCGTGVLFDFVTNKGYSYSGVDISEDMLQQARIKYPQGKFIQGDVTKAIPQLVVGKPPQAVIEKVARKGAPSYIVLLIKKSES